MSTPSWHHRLAWAPVLFPILVFYPVVAWAVFQFRHPIANESVFWTHFATVMSFGEVPEFQSKPNQETP